MATRSHHDNVEKQFSSQANAYLTSAVHASGRDLQRPGERLSAFPEPTCWRPSACTSRAPPER
jgi:hypothetical protein